MKKVYLPFIFLICFVLFFSCENEESLIGENLLNHHQNELFIVNNIAIDVSNQLEDSVSAESSTSLLGSYVDPISGQTNASFYFQITLPNNEMEFNATVVDSIELNLPYSGFFGNENTMFNITLSQLNTSINPDEGAGWMTDTLFDCTEISGTNRLITLSEIQDSGALNMSFPINFGLNEILNLESEYLNNNEVFTEAFFGFKLDVEPICCDGEGAIAYFDNSSDNAFFQIKYQSDESPDSVSFPIGNGVTINSIQNNYGNFDVGQDTTVLFLQSMGGAFVELDFSALRDSLNTDSTYIVNEAILSFYISER